MRSIIMKLLKMKNRPAPCSQIPGKLRICRVCSGPLSYSSKGRAELKCRDCGYIVAWDECILCGGKLEGIAQTDCESACETCGLVQDRYGYALPREMYDRRFKSVKKENEQ
jgi:hypothetical protein